MVLRRKAVFVATGLMALALLVPSLVGAHSPTSCNGVTNEAGGTGTTDITLQDPVTNTVVGYVNIDATNDTEAGHTPGVFLETNGTAGLQTHDHTCRTQPNDPSTEITIPADAGIFSP